MRCRFLIVILAFVFISTIIPSRISVAGTGVERNGKDFEVEFKVLSDWGRGFNAQITLTNIGEETIENWALSFNFDRTIINLWTADLIEQVGDHYFIKNQGWNADILPGHKIEIGFEGRTGHVKNGPENYRLCMCKQIVDTEKYSVDFIVTSDWEQAFIGEIQITNRTNKPIEAWEIEFDFDHPIERFEAAQIVNQYQGRYTVKHMKYNSTINPGQRLALGFKGSPGGVIQGPSNLILQEIVICDEIDTIPSTS